MFSAGSVCFLWGTNIETLYFYQHYFIPWQLFRHFGYQTISQFAFYYFLIKFLNCKGEGFFFLLISSKDYCSLDKCCCCGQTWINSTKLLSRYNIHLLSMQTPIVFVEFPLAACWAALSKTRITLFVYYKDKTRKNAENSVNYSIMLVLFYKHIWVTFLWFILPTMTAC